MDVVKHPDNAHLISELPDSRHRLGINVGFHIHSPLWYTLATLGRSGDITVEGPSISRIHCTFEINEKFGTVILYDRSTSQSTQVSGEVSLPFEPGGVRRVAVAPRLNTILGIGGVRCDLIRFEMVWHQRKFDVKEHFQDRVDNPRLALREGVTPTSSPTARFRYVLVRELGNGQCGKVFEGIEAESGRAMAVKVVKHSALGFSQDSLISLKREVGTMATIFHPHIVEYIGHQLTGEKLEIFTALTDGSVEDLIHQGLFGRESDYHPARLLLHHVVIGIDYLENAKIVHRDIKPANILFTKKSVSDIHFQIADFGLCNFTDTAQSYSGTPVFMAPEVLRHDGERQTSKVDVWSLFVTMAYVLDANGYRKKQLKTKAQIITAALEAAQTPLMVPFKDMAILDPNERASAAGILRKLFNGQGLTTLLDQIQDRTQVPAGMDLGLALNRSTPASYGESANQVRSNSGS